MDVKGTTPLPSAGAPRPVEKAASPAPQKKLASVARVERPAGSGDDLAAASEKIGALLTDLAGPDLGNGGATRLQIDIDQAAGRVYGRVIDQSTGEPVAEIPSKEMRALLARAREMFGPLFDVKA